MTKKYSGQCLCGNVKYDVDVDPVFMGNCHCKDCQRTSGSAFIPAMIFPEESITISGEVKNYTVTTASGDKHTRGFCPNCGSQLFGSFSRMSGLLGIKAGTLDKTNLYSPALDFHVASAASWDFMDPDLPKKNNSAQS